MALDFTAKIIKEQKGSELIKKIQCIVGVILAGFMAFGMPVNAAEHEYSWHCVRNKEHKQPVQNSKLDFVEENGGYHVDKKHGDDAKEKVVYLTFDAGYENGNVAKVLDVLKAESVPGAFFILGNLVTSNTDLIQRMISEGHTVCNHTYSHKNITKLTSEQLEEELKRLEDTYTQYTDAKLSKFFRPPEGRFSEAALKHLNSLGYKTIFWSFAYADWDNDKQMSSEAAKEKILSNIHNGAILLLHPTSETNAKILGDVIRTLKSEGYQFGTLDRLVAQ